jgi:6-pyruvoyltetrahydropterin/6-carboxytetrahydropterin synthase
MSSRVVEPWAPGGVFRPRRRKVNRQAKGGFFLEQGFFELKVISSFAAAHNLREFRGKCENLHGHNWKVEVVLRGKSLASNGILVDFGEVKAEVRAILEEMDHKYLNELPFFTTNNPSSENITRFLFEKLAVKFNAGDTRVYSVTAWESEEACATYIVE